MIVVKFYRPGVVNPTAHVLAQRAVFPDSRSAVQCAYFNRHDRNCQFSRITVLRGREVLRDHEQFQGQWEDCREVRL